MTYQREILENPIWPLSVRIYIRDGLQTFRERIHAARSEHPEHTLRLCIMSDPIASSCVLIDLDHREHDLDTVWKEAKRDVK